MKVHNMNINDVIQKYHANPVFGLNDNEVIANQKHFGPNIIKPINPNLFYQFVKGLQDPVVLILLIVSLITLIFNPAKWYIALILFSFAIIDIVYGMHYIYKTINTLDKFKPQNVKVYRNSEVIVVNAEDVVIGDILVLEKGDYVACDARVIRSHHLELDESIISNNNSPILKQTNAIKEKTNDLTKMRNMVFANTYVLNGRGLGIVVNAGNNNTIYQLMAENNFNQNTPLHHNFNLIFKIITFMMIFISLYILGIEIKFGINLNDALFTAINSTIRILPECLVLVVGIIFIQNLDKYSNYHTINTTAK